MLNTKMRQSQFSSPPHALKDYIELSLPPSLSLSRWRTSLNGIFPNAYLASFIQTVFFSQSPRRLRPTDRGLLGFIASSLPIGKSRLRERER